MLIAVDKPVWLTSFDIVRIFKRQFPWQKIGHGGTLDPLATGLLILGIGNETKQLTHIIGKDKSYEATIDFSLATDTWDSQYRKDCIRYPLAYENGNIQGIIKNGYLVSAPSLPSLETLLSSLIPQHILPLPPFSAKKHQGKRFYQDARAWIHIEKTQSMTFYNYTIISYTFPLLTLKVDVGSWTYIRSLAYRLGQQCNLWGALVSLRRTRIWSLDIATLCPSRSLEIQRKYHPLTLGYYPLSEFSL